MEHRRFGDPASKPVPFDAGTLSAEINQRNLFSPINLQKFYGIPRILWVKKAISFRLTKVTLIL
jgi:hypothetical protein